jgi:hypothetical protein
VLDVMQTLLAAGRSGGAREVETACEVPQPLALTEL